MIRLGVEACIDAREPNVIRRFESKADAEVGAK